jgi:hypothetical protein
LVFLGAITFCLGGSALSAGAAHAQTVQGEATVTVGQPPSGQVTVQAPQPYGYPQTQPPPGYGGQVYVQPQPYAQPQPYVQQPYYAQPVQPAQPRVVQRQQSITGLWVSGIIIFPVSWVLTWSAATATLDSSRDIDYWLWSWVPLVGPWFMLGQGDDTSWGRGLNESEIAGALLAGVAQLAGLTMFILGLSIKQTVNVTTYALDQSERPTQISFGVAPALAGGQLTATLTHF